LQLKLDDKTIEAKSLLYPEEVREPMQWVAAYCRDRCNHQISVLCAKCKDLKFETDYTYWHKIFAGKYFLIAPQTGKPVGSVKNFLQIVEALRRRDRIDWRAGSIPFVETGTWNIIRDRIDIIRQLGRVNRFLGIAGPTGSQKTACFKEYKQRNNHGRVTHLEAPERPRMTQFINDLARCYGETVMKTMDRNIWFITQTVNETKTIIVDNVQRLYQPDMEGDQPIFNFLQKLQDDTGCAIVLSFTPLFVRTLKQGMNRGYFEQFIGRMGGERKLLILPDYAPRADVLAIANAFGLQDAEKHADYLETIAREPGRIRTLFDDLQAAKQLAEDKPFTIAQLREAREEEE